MAARIWCDRCISASTSTCRKRVAFLSLVFFAFLAILVTFIAKSNWTSSTSTMPLLSSFHQDDLMSSTFKISGALTPRMKELVRIHINQLRTPSSIPCVMLMMRLQCYALHLRQSHSSNPFVALFASLSLLFTTFTCALLCPQPHNCRFPPSSSSLALSLILSS